MQALSSSSSSRDHDEREGEKDEQEPAIAGGLSAGPSQAARVHLEPVPPAEDQKENQPASKVSGRLL